MKINRLDFTRVLKIIKSMDENSVRFKENGEFGVGKESEFLIGRGINFNKSFGILDIDMLLKILDSINAVEINIEFDGLKMYIMNSSVGIKYGYNLADEKVVDSIDKQDFEAEEKKPEWTWVRTTFKIEDLNRLRKIISTFSGKSDTIYFKEEEGKLIVGVGSEKMFFGELSLNSIGLIGKVNFEAKRFNSILQVLDDKEIKFSFGFQQVNGIESKTQHSILKIENQEFSWLLGALLSE